MSETSVNYKGHGFNPIYQQARADVHLNVSQTTDVTGGFLTVNVCKNGFAEKIINL